MMTAIKRTLPDLLMLLIVAAVSGWSGWESVRIYGDELSLSSQSHLFGLRPAALFAAGLGLGHTDCEEQEFPELDAFMERNIAAIPRSAYPEACEKPFGRNFHFYFHYYLIAYMGGMFRLFGISVGTIHLACVLMHMAAMMFLYLLFRLVMGRLLSLAGILYITTSPVFLVVLPDFRDYGKVPFLLAALFLMGYIPKETRSPRRQVLLSLALGSVIGVGYGFRQDLLICMPPAVMLLLFGARISSPHPWRWRVATALVTVAAFAVVSFPVFKGRQESGGFIMAHTLLQGITSSVEGEIHFGSADYDFGFLGLDTPVIASVAAYAQRTGRKHPDSYVSREYGEAGASLFCEVVRTFPADMAARALAAVEHTFHIPGSRFIEETMRLEPYSSNGQFLRLSERVHAPIDRFFSAWGPLCAIVFILLLAAQGYRCAFWVCGLFFYFAAYPSLLAECRHLFYLAFVPVFFTGGLFSLAFGRICNAFQRRKERSSRPLLAGAAGGTLKGILFVILLAGGITVPLIALRLYQHSQVSRLLDNYDAVQLTSLPYEKERWENMVRLCPAHPLPEVLGVAPPDHGQVVPAYLAAKFKEADRTVAFTLLNENDAFVRPCHIRLNGTGIYFFPVFEFGAVTNAVFTGIELPAEDADLFEGLYLVEHADAFPLWPFIAVPEEKARFIPCKTGRMDRRIEMLGAELKAGFGLAPERGAYAYFPSIQRYPYHTPFAERALGHARRCEHVLPLLRTWEHIGRYMPDLRDRAAAWISKEADHLRESGSLPLAFAYYEAAAKVSPGELWNQVRMGEILAGNGDYAAAIALFQHVLERAPESPYTAKRLDDLFVEQGYLKEAERFWKALAEAHPDTSVPQLFLGISLERSGNPDAAHDAYALSLKINPAHAPAVYRLGALKAERGAIEQGADMMRKALKLDPALASEISERCARAAAKLTKQKQYEDAIYLNHTALELFPENLRPHVQLGDIYESEGNFNAALEQYLIVLKRAPESPETARRLDALTQRMGWDNHRRVQLWQDLVERYPDAREPSLYLHKCRSEKKDRAVE